MFSISTAEIRWFYTGSPPEPLLVWLQELDGLYENQSPRTDRYLLLPAQDNLGIKLREGRIEIKKRTGAHPQYSNEQIAGHVESWFKWSIPLESGHNPVHAFMHARNHWVDIRKIRSVQKFALDEELGLILPPELGYPSEGLMVECSALRMDNKAWWTFAIECFGPADRVYSNLIAVIPGLLSGHFPIALSTSQSSGYPEWINRHE